MSNPEQVVRDLMTAIHHQDLEGMLSLLTEDVVFVNGSRFTIRGRDDMRDLFSNAAKRIEHDENELVNIVSSGNIVMTERVDKLKLDGRAIALPIMGTFEIRDGLIAQWRDYFDPSVSDFQRD